MYCNKHLARVNLFAILLSSWHVNIGFVLERLCAKLKLVCVSVILVFKVIVSSNIVAGLINYKI